MAHAMEGLELPPEVALQPGKVVYRAGDHELMPNIFVGEVHPPKAAIRTTCSPSSKLVPGEKAAGTVADTGCQMTLPGDLTQRLRAPAARGVRARSVHRVAEAGQCCKSSCSTSPTG